MLSLKVSGAFHTVTNAFEVSDLCSIIEFYVDAYYAIYHDGGVEAVGVFWPLYCSRDGFENFW